MSEIIFLVEEAPEGGYSARALGHSIFTEADDLDSVRKNIRQAIDCHFEDGKGPKIIRLVIMTLEPLSASYPDEKTHFVLEETLPP